MFIISYSDNLVRSNFIHIILESSIDNFIIYKNNLGTIPITKSEKNLNPTESDKIIDYRKYQFQAIIMLSAFYEGLINEIGLVELGENYFKKYLDKLSILNKWEVVLKLVFGKSIKRDSHHYGNLHTLIQRRNELVHHKSISIKGSSNEGILIDDIQQHIDKYGIHFQILEENFNSVKFFIEEVNSIFESKNKKFYFDFSEQLNRY